MKKITSTNFENQQTLHAECDAAFALSKISGRWKLSILTNIQKGADRFSLLKIAIPSITERVLALQLSELESSGLVIKTTDKERAPVYQLSAAGLAMMPLINDLAGWGITFKAISGDNVEHDLRRFE